MTNVGHKVVISHKNQKKDSRGVEYQVRLRINKEVGLQFVRGFHPKLYEVNGNIVFLSATLMELFRYHVVNNTNFGLDLGKVRNKELNYYFYLDEKLTEKAPVVRDFKIADNETTETYLLSRSDVFTSALFEILEEKLRDNTSFKRMEVVVKYQSSTYGNQHKVIFSYLKIRTTNGSFYANYNTVYSLSNSISVDIGRETGGFNTERITSKEELLVFKLDGVLTKETKEEKERIKAYINKTWLPSNSAKIRAMLT